MKILFVYDRSEQGATARTALVTAVAHAEAEGMFVEVEAELTTPAMRGQVPSVQIDGVVSDGTDAITIYNAIARAYRRPARLRATLPRARSR